MIKPTIGRRVWYWPSANDLSDRVFDTPMRCIDSAQPFDAGVVYVWGDRMVNLAVTDHQGVVHIRTSVQLRQDGDEPRNGSGYAEWMPYQAGQAKKAEQPSGEAHITTTELRLRNDAVIGGSPLTTDWWAQRGYGSVSGFLATAPKAETSPNH